VRLRYNRWTVLRFDPVGQRRQVLARCRCGTVRRVQVRDLRAGRSHSCGCWKREQTQRRFRTHGESHRTAEYRIWAAMLTRCRNPNVRGYADYGGRGVCVCRRWRRYENFLQDMGRRPPGRFLERRDNQRGYSQRNCYWATATEQAWNKRNNRMLTYNGVCLPLTEWARRLGIRHATLRERLERDWPRVDVFNPRKHHGRSRLCRPSSNSAS
jgi:hypothetical protein